LSIQIKKIYAIIENIPFYVPGEGAFYFKNNIVSLFYKANVFINIIKVWGCDTTPPSPPWAQYAKSLSTFTCFPLGKPFFQKVFLD